jgi:hypothetical protein
MPVCAWRPLGVQTCTICTSGQESASSSEAVAGLPTAVRTLAPLQSRYPSHQPGDPGCLSLVLPARWHELRPRPHTQQVSTLDWEIGEMTSSAVPLFFLVASPRVVLFSSHWCVVLLSQAMCCGRAISGSTISGCHFFSHSTETYPV